MLTHTEGITIKERHSVVSSAECAANVAELSSKMEKPSIGASDWLNFEANAILPTIDAEYTASDRNKY